MKESIIAIRSDGEVSKEFEQYENSLAFCSREGKITTGRKEGELTTPARSMLLCVACL
jgi:hypothetical protein